MLKDYAYRTVDATITNKSGGPLKLVRVDMPWGRWVDETPMPPELAEIADQATVRFKVETAIYLSGCEGSIVYDVANAPGTQWTIYWDNPYLGQNTYTQTRTPTSTTIPDGVVANEDKQDDDLARCTYVCNGAQPAAQAGTQVAGEQPPVQSATGGTKPAHISLPVDQQEVIWMMAGFPYEYASPKVEVELLRAGHWSPTSRDFDAILSYEIEAHNNKHAIKVVKPLPLTNLQSFVNAFIGSAEGKVGRVNIVTHANGNLLALSGKVDGTTGTTMLNTWAPAPVPRLDPTNHPEEAEAARKYYLDNSKGIALEAFSNFDHTQGFFNREGKAERDFIRKKLAPGAEIHLYSCHSADGFAVSTNLLKQMANTFNAWVYGFTTSLHYIPKVAGSSITARTETGIGSNQADAIAHKAAGVLHNDLRRVFIGELGPSEPYK